MPAVKPAHPTNVEDAGKNAVVAGRRPAPRVSANHAKDAIVSFMIPRMLALTLAVSLTASSQELTDRYRATAGKLIEAALADTEG